MKRKLSAAIVAALAAAAIGGGSAYAAKAAKQEDAFAIISAPVSLAQAIAAAEQHVGGKAAKAELEDENGQWVFGVEVVKDATQVMDVKVDAATGKVLSATADTADTEQADEHEDENDKD
jgi:uncharacterized membrane protein YkoI